MANSLTDKIIFGLGVILYFSDLLFPLWLAGILIYLRNKGWCKWKAWSVASTFCLVQAYIVAKTIGYNVGAYVLIGIGLIASSIFNKLLINTSITKYFTPLHLDIEFWVAPPIVIVILPAFVLYVISKLSKDRGCVSNK